MGRPGFWNFMAKGYARQAIADPAAYEYKLKRTQELFTPETRVFEFGCGTGSTALIHAPHVAAIRAIDFSAKMIEIARGKAQAQGITNVTFDVATIDDEPLPATPYDAVLGMSILHLLDNRRAVIAKAHAMLRPGGHFLSSTVCVPRSRAFRVLAALGRPFGLSLNFLTAETLEQEMRQAGFEIVESWQPAPDKALFLVCRKPA